MYYGAVKTYDIANGPGVRVSLFVSGCTHHCKGCFNAETWSFTYGQPYTEQTESDILHALAPAYISGLSLLGGEPFERQNQETLVGLLRRVREMYPEKTVWCYTGYTYESDLLCESRARCTYTDEMLSMLDVLVDGEFLEEKKNISLAFRGSENQRLIDLRATRAQGRTVLWNP